MGTPRAVMFRVLHELPENVLVPESVLRARVLDQCPQLLRGDGLDRALADVHRLVGLTAGLVLHSGRYEWGLALRRKITAMPRDVLTLFGAEIHAEAAP